MSVLVCLLLWSLVEVHSQTEYPLIIFMGETLPNHGYLDLTLVGEDTEADPSDTVRCRTDLVSCCSTAEGPHRGDWYYPNGDVVRLEYLGDGIYGRREARQAEIHRRNNANSPSGIYRCDIATNAVHNESDTSVRETVYLGLYATGGDITISGNITLTVTSDLTGPSPQFTLTCNSTGGPATTVTWTRDSVTVTEGTETVLDDPVTAQYTHTLTGTMTGLYTCTVANNKPSSDTAQLYVEASRIGFEMSEYTVKEGGSVTVSVMAGGGALERDVVVTVMTTDDSAVAGSDYIPLSTDLTFNSSDHTHSVMVMTTGDSLLEGEESFTLRLSSNNTNTSAVVTIIDTTTATIGFQTTVYTVREGETVNATVSVAATGVTLARDVMVNVAVNSAGSPDVTADPTVLTFSSNTLSCNTTISAVSDMILEGSEQASISLTDSDPNVYLGPNMSTITITDTDMVTIGFDMSIYSVREGESVTASISVTSTGVTLGRDVLVTVKPDGDVTVDPTLLTFSADRLSHNVTVSASDNSMSGGGSGELSIALTGGELNVLLNPHTVTITIADAYLFFQLHFLEVIGSCHEFVSDNRDAKLEDITNAVLGVLTDSCADCGITNDVIDMLSFRCFPESPSHVTYRARLTGTSETDSSSLISLLEDWVRGGADIIVTGLLLTVDSECSVEISSLSEGECFETTTDSTGGSGISPGAIIAGVVAVLVILIIAISIIIVVVLIRRCRRRNTKKRYEVNSPLERGRGSVIATTSNVAYEMARVGEVGDGEYEVMSLTPLTAVSGGAMYEIPLAPPPQQPLPPIPLTKTTPTDEGVANKENDDGVYDSIPGDQ